MKHFVVIVILLFLFGCDYYKQPTVDQNRNPSPDHLLLEIQDQHRFISTDIIADRLINKDPSLFLVDVRPPDQFENFALPGAANIPLEEILDPGNNSILDDAKYDIVFYSNADLAADQAWMVKRQSGCLNCYVLKGGLSAWFETIVQPQKPPETADANAIELYAFRRAACQYFTGTSVALTPEPFTRKVVKKTVKVKPKPQKKVVAEEEEEGC